MDKADAAAPPAGPQGAKPADHGARGDAALFSETDMLREEERLLWPNGKPTLCAGLALSGGGIRASTVALGVLQTLAASGLLPRFQYLSTVSGGGYIGASLSWFWSKRRVAEESALAQMSGPSGPLPKRFGTEAASFPFQDPCDKPTELQQAAIANLTFLRNHGSYLTSGDGIGFAGLILAVLRTVLLSLAVWLPLLVLLFGVLELVDHSLLESEIYLACTSGTPQSEDLFGALGCRPSFKIILIGAGILVLAFFEGVVLFSFLGRRQRDSSVRTAIPRRRYRRIAAYLAAFIAILAFAISNFRGVDSIQPAMGVELALLPLFAVACFMMAVAEFFRPANRGYFLRRSFEKLSSLILPNVVAALFIGALPLIVSALKPSSSTALAVLGPMGGVAALLSGVTTALYGYYLKAKSLLPGVAEQIFAMLGSLVFLSGLLLFSFVAAGQIFVFNHSAGSHANSLIAAFGSLVLVAVATGMFGSINTTGLHRFYRDRLMETFLPMTDAVSKGSAQESDAADNFSVVDVAGEGSEPADRPYHLINTHAILVNDRDPKVALRGGDNFLISSAFVGSATTGWMRTKQYVQEHGALTLASAMAVSGAAANANAGYVGTGLTRDRFVSAVMSILNIRLGLWVGNPKVTAKSVASVGTQEGRPRERLRTKVATYFRPVLIAGIFGFGHHRDAPFLELSDGGHFENLGLYELIRRRLDLILVVDAEQDGDMSLAALVSSTNRIKEDFGVSVDFLDSRGPEVLLGKDSERYPSGARLAKSPFLAAEVRYPALPEMPGKRPAQLAKRGVLIYIKSTMVAGLTFATDGYKAANPDFPHQSTADQFFDPDQFEAYRDLGKKSCAAMIEALGLDANVMSAVKLLERYGFPSCGDCVSTAMADRDHAQ